MIHKRWFTGVQFPWFTLECLFWSNINKMNRKAQYKKAKTTFLC
jgi:hypothetical protein